MTPALLRLLQLVSPTLPVGAYTYSQGLEWAVESGAVRDEASAMAWIGDCLEHGVARFEAVYLAHMLQAWRDGDRARLSELDAEFRASRESAELRAETLQMGHSMIRLLSETAWFPSGLLADFEPASFPLAWSAAAAHGGIDAREAVAGYLWAWAENQVMAAIKAIPLGQTAGQRLLWALGGRIPVLAEDAVAAPILETHNFLPAFAIASSQHETQYTRIFRS